MSKRVSLPAILATTLLIAAWIASSVSANRVGADLQQLLSFGVVLQTDRAFYEVGETATVRHGPYNFTADQVIEWVPSFGGNGCTFWIRVYNDAGEIVWEPRPNCSRAPSAPIRVGRGGGLLSSQETIPLIYQNNSGVGSPGAPLPAGFYQVRLTSVYTGPHRKGEFRSAFAQPTEAAVAIRIE